MTLGERCDEILRMIDAVLDTDRGQLEAAPVPVAPYDRRARQGSAHEEER